MHRFFLVQDFDNIGTINGQTAVELDMENLEEKPWRKPGADITDYFNYGFTEDTWAAYCNRSFSSNIYRSLLHRLLTGKGDCELMSLGWDSLGNLQFCHRTE